MDESFLGGFASQKLGRLTNSDFSNGFMVHGYGIFFTSKRLIGLTYRRVTLVAYLIPFCIFLFWLGILLPVVSWGVQNDPQGFALPLPAYILGPPLLGLPLLVAAFVVYLSPHRVKRKIEHEKPASLLELTRHKPDLSLERDNISQVTIDRDPNPVFQRTEPFGFRTTLTMKTGQQYSFDFVEGGLSDFFSLLRAFCELAPPISILKKL